MTATPEELERLETALADIETSVVTTEQVSRTFRVEMEKVSETMAGASQQATGFRGRLDHPSSPRWMVDP